MNKIPRVAHFYWGRNKPLSFMRWMSVVSFVNFNQDWLVRVYAPECPSKAMSWATPEHKDIGDYRKDFFDALDKVPNVSIHMMKSGFLDLPDETPEVHKSDLLRWHLLASRGGLWSDFDILYVAPVRFLGIEPETDVVLCCQQAVYRKYSKGPEIAGDIYNSVGFMLGGEIEGQKFFLGVEKEARARAGSREYQGLGRFVLDKFYDLSGNRYDAARVFNLSPLAVYPIPAYQVKQLYEPAPRPLSRETIGIHWFAGHRISGGYEARVGPLDAPKERGLLFRYMVRVLTELGIGSGPLEDQEYR